MTISSTGSPAEPNVDPRRKTWGNRPSIMEINPHAAAKLSPEHNGGVAAWEICASSNKKYFWNCAGHLRQTTPEKISAGRGCGICAFRVLLVGFNDLATANPEYSSQLDPRRNDGVTASMAIGGQSNESYWWTCHVEGRADHYWWAPVYSRTRGSGCGVCDGKVLLIGFNDLATTHPHLVCQFLPEKNGGRSASMVFGGRSTKPYIWTCGLGHDWPATVDSRSLGKGCGVCAFRVLLRGFNDLATTNPKLVCELDPRKNGGLTAEMIIGGKSNKMRIWTCAQNHDWAARVSDRAAGSGCKKCSKEGTSKVEQALLRVCATALGKVQGGVKVGVPWRKHRSMSLDVLGDFDGRAVVLEYDSWYYHRRALSVARDTEKTLALLEAGYLIARIRQCGLQHLDIEHPNLVQIDHDYRYGPDDQLEADLAPGVDLIMSWCEGRAGATPRESDS